MKENMKYYLIFLMVFLFANFSSKMCAAQDSTVVKKKAYVSLKYKNDKGEESIQFNVITREDRKRIPVEYTIVNLYLNDISKSGMLGNVTTDENGEGTVFLANKFKGLSDTLTEYNFIGSLKNDPRLKNTEAELSIKKAKLDISLYEEDSVRFVKIIATQKTDSAGWVPIPELEIGLFVKRYFSLLSITEYPVSTEENGEAIFEFPDGLKGDSLGFLSIVAKIDNHDDYGTLIVSGKEKWGIPVIDEKDNERLLSGSRKNAPLFLVIVSNAIILGVWGIIVFIIFQLFKIKSFSKPKVEHHEELN